MVLTMEAAKALEQSQQWPYLFSAVLREDVVGDSYKILRPKRAAKPSFMRSFIWRVKKILDGRNVRTRSVSELVAGTTSVNGHGRAGERTYLLGKSRCPKNPLGETVTNPGCLTYCLHIRSPTLARSSNRVPKTFHFAALNEDSYACHLRTIQSQLWFKCSESLELSGPHKFQNAEIPMLNYFSRVRLMIWLGSLVF